jgi:hypothetical protein
MPWLLRQPQEFHTGFNADVTPFEIGDQDIQRYAKRLEANEK